MKVLNKYRFGLTVIGILLFNASRAQEMYVGDSLAMNSLKEKASEVYEAFDSTFFISTKNNFGIVESYGSSLIVNTIDGEIARIVSLNHSANGILGSEWYFDQNTLFYTYFSFEQFEEVKSQFEWRNFKGIKGWESRFYFSNNEIISQRHKGLSSNEEFDFESIQNQSSRLVIFVKKLLK